MPNNAKETKKTEEKKENVVIIEGTVLVAYFGQSQHDKSAKNRIAIDTTSGMDELRKLYTEVCTSPLRPKWEHDDNETVVNLKSVFDIPCRGVDAFTDINPEATVKVKIKVKDGGIYPQAIVVKKNGKPIDAFEGM